jgi:hypothetical protein
MVRIGVYYSDSSIAILRLPLTSFAVVIVQIAGAVVRNLVASQVLLTALLYPDISNMTLLPAGNKDQEAPPSKFTLTVFTTLLSIIRDHPMNYFLLERLNILSYAIERLDTYHPELQVGFFLGSSFCPRYNHALVQSLIMISNDEHHPSRLSWSCSHMCSRI